MSCNKCIKCLEGKTIKLGGYDFPSDMVMILCITCGNKRCPHATNCALECTNSNEPGQKGSVYE